MGRSRTNAAAVEALLEHYAGRGVFRGFSASGPKFRMRWHRDREFELIFDEGRGTLRFPALLPKFDAAMLADLKAFVAERQSAAMPEHRRVDPSKVKLTLTRRGGDVALTATALDGDVDYAVRKLIHLVQEVYLVFLHDGKYYDYLVETFNLDPDFIQFS